MQFPRIKSSGGPKIPQLGIQSIIGTQQQASAMLGRGQIGQEQLPSDSTVLGQHDPATGVNRQTKEGQQFSASGDLIKKSVNQASSTVQAINLLDHYEKTFKDVYGDIIDKGGNEGQVAASQKYLTGFVQKKDPKMVAFLGDLPNTVSLLQRAVSETGNIAMQKEVREGKALPVLTPNSHISNLFMPDDPQTALAKFHGLKSQLMDTLQQNLEMAKSGKPDLIEAKGDVSQAKSNSSPNDPLDKFRQKYMSK